MKHVMVDLETLGIRPGSAIRSVGAAAFTLGQPDVGPTFYKKVNGQMPKLLELLEVLADHRDPRILEALLEHKELIDFVILNAHSSRGARTFLKAQRIIVRCMQAADPSSDRITVSRVMRAFR